jgi:hypothetical protein
MARVRVAGIRTFVAGGRGKTVPIGVDVHKRSYSVALFRSDGAWKEWTAPGADPPCGATPPSKSPHRGGLDPDCRRRRSWRWPGNWPFGSGG